MVEVTRPEIFVVLATFNGEGVLSRTLEGYARTLPPSRKWSIVVVDNGSTDQTPEILKRYQSSLPIKIIAEGRPGKNRALNSALEHIGYNGDIYIFTDDDAIPNKRFLVSWESALDTHPERELFGGTVTPYFSVNPPRWLHDFKDHFPEIYAENERDTGEIEADQIFGPNMAVRGSVLRAGHRFNESIGPNSAQSAYPMGSETEFCRRVGAAISAPAWFAAEPSVQHIVRAEQMTRDFLRRRAFRHGRGWAMQQALQGRPFKLTPLLAAKRVAYRAIASAGNAQMWWRSNWLDGVVEYSSQQSRPASQPEG